jgi:hypothetical protein
MGKDALSVSAEYLLSSLTDVWEMQSDSLPFHLTP